MDSIYTAMNMIRENAYMSKLDLKNAYYCVPIRESDKKFLKFVFKNKLYKYNVLPNGYTEGPRKFTKATKPILATLRKIGIAICAYIDDFLLSCKLKQTCFENTLKTIGLFEKLGFIINHTKSILEPIQTITFLGYDLNSASLSIQLTESKKLKTKEMCENLLVKSHISIREIAQLLGIFSSSFTAVEHSKLHYRSLERCKNKALKYSKGNFEGKIILDEPAKNNICWWRDNIIDSFPPLLGLTHLFPFVQMPV